MISLTKTHNQPHDDGSLEPLEGLATSPSILQTWPFRLTRLVSRQIVSQLPPSIQEKAPAFLRPAVEIPDPEESYDVPKQTRKNKSRTNTPRDSPRDTPVGTDLETEDDVLDTEGEEGKKKKRGVGKAGGARRRKLALKK